MRIDPPEELQASPPLRSSLEKSEGLPILLTQGTVRERIGKIAEFALDKVAFAVTGAILIALLVLCAGNLLYEEFVEWLKKLSGTPPDDSP